MTVTQLTGRRERLLRELTQCLASFGEASHINRLREEIDLVEKQLAAQCIPLLTDVIRTSVRASATHTGHALSGYGR